MNAVNLGMFSRRKNDNSKKRADEGNITSRTSYDVEDGIVNSSSSSSNIIYNGPSSQKFSTKSRHSHAAAAAAATCSSFVFGGQAYQQIHRRKRRQPQGYRFLFFRIFSSLVVRRLLVIVVILTLALALYDSYRIKTATKATHPSTTVKTKATTTTDINNSDLSSSSANVENQQHQQQQQQQQHQQQQHIHQQQQHNRPLLLDLSQLPSLEWERQREIDRRHHLDNDVANNNHNQIHHNQIHHNSEQINQLLEHIVPKWAKRHDTVHMKKQAKFNYEKASKKKPNSSKVVAPSATLTRTLQSMTTNGTCPLLTDPTTTSVSLLIHSTLDRLWLMEETCRRWTGPIILVVYYRNDNTSAISTTEHSGQHPWMQILDWNTACPQVKLVPVAAAQNEEEWQYPVNKLRNIGLEALETPLFLMMDVDFLPSENLERAIKNHFMSTTKYYYESKKQQGNRIAMVVPAFERMKASCSTVEECKKFLKNDPHFIPRSFEGIGFCVKTGYCAVFQEDDNWEGHYTTDSETWLRGNFYDDTTKNPIINNTNVARKISCFHSYRYEPYLVLQWCKDSTPFYDERFYGYGKNKIEYISHLRFLNYSFHVLPEGFIVHHPHVDSKAKTVWNNVQKHDLHAKMDKLYPQFLSELYETYGLPALRQC